jgi:hypothetical protein
MPLTIEEQTDVLRHLNYPLSGLMSVSPAGGSLAPANNAYRYFQSYGQLQYRMSQLAPNEESRITGKPFGAVGFNNNNALVVPGSVITITLTSTALGGALPLVYTVQDDDTLLSVCGGLAQVAALNTTFTGAGFYAINDFGNGPYSEQVVPFPIVSFIGPTTTTSFTIAVSLSEFGQPIPQIVANGALLAPVLYLDTTIPAEKIYGFLPILDFLESAQVSSVQNLSVHKAREFTRNPKELREKQMLYKYWQYKLAQFMGVSLDLNNHGARGRSGMMSV